MPKIHSTIEITYDGCREDCKMPKNKLESNSAEHSHHYKSEAKSDKNRFFHHVQTGNQTVNVNVKVEQPQENCLTGCFSALAKCFSKGG